ncbi:hypothetical protein Aple_010720 [Acrocarpospora pleiomorpha]|uniref:Head-tail adaptor protein n=1 Tax=Acrocarpospora pleiomorpha TaxID=90975 RepID=A0A5M3X8X4_9ACTN|nr:head-tail adaptor protein [Acrocarpospora pleiomorpha]GES18177.1 hypothetical protein Aple_010720 [Acrocarpospora pleiomorpha]
MSIDHLLNTTAAVTRKDDTDDGGGGRASAWVAVGILPCRRSQPTAIEREVAAAGGGDLSWPVYFSAGADIKRGDRLQVDGLALEVLAVYPPSQHIYLRADCRHRQGEEPL